MNRELISIKPYRNIKATVFSLFVLILYFGLHIIMFRYLFEEKDILTIQRDRFIQTYMGILWFLVIGSIIWSYKVAKQRGREPALWIVLGFMAGPVGLLILCFKDYYIKDFRIKDIIQKTRVEFKTHLTKELSTIIEKEEKKRRRAQITQEYQELLYNRCSKIFTAEKIDLIKDLADKGIIDPNIDIAEKARIIEKIESHQLKRSDEIEWKTEWTENESLCPACGTELEKTMNNCINCGLRIK